MAADRRLPAGRRRAGHPASACRALGELIARRFTTFALIRAPFWMLLTALAAGQLLFNRALSRPWRAFLVRCWGPASSTRFVQQQERSPTGWGWRPCWAR